ncbi:hypothetical protein ABIE13_003663 [Ottowia thiooxydans]|uniref:Uncharacterized protein n=1 Tax=Ottowia thiooxydans TaxID=219182 RepID=A0ABV2QDB8_9BURK
MGVIDGSCNSLILWQRAGRGRPTGEGKRRLSCCLCFLITFCSLIEVGGRGVRPAAQPPSFGRRSGAPPKEPGARKGGPTVRDPSLRYGQPPVLGPGAVRQNSLLSLRSIRSNSCRKLVHEARASCSALARPWPCAPRHGQRGGTPTRAIAALGPRISGRWREKTRSAAFSDIRHPPAPCP